MSDLAPVALGSDCHSLRNLAVHFNRRGSNLATCRLLWGARLDYGSLSIRWHVLYALCRHHSWRKNRTCEVQLRRGFHSSFAGFGVGPYRHGSDLPTSVSIGAIGCLDLLLGYQKDSAAAIGASRSSAVSTYRHL